jgi:hypothetical protein
MNNQPKDGLDGGGGRARDEMQTWWDVWEQRFSIVWGSKFDDKK